MPRPLRVGLVALVAPIIALATASAAFALAGGTDDGFEVAVDVRFTGDAAPAGGGTTTVWVPPRCYWERLGQPFNVPDDLDPDDEEAMSELYGEFLGAFSGYRDHAWWARYTLPSRETFEESVRKVLDGETVTWYAARCQDPDDYIRLGYNGGVTDVNGASIATAWRYFVAGETVPPPAVDPEDLAEAARDVMVIAEPQVDRNPQVGALADATFVNLATWFWVEDPESLGGADGTRTIRAEVVDGAVWAEVTAETGGLSLSSPRDSTQCTRDEALTRWASGISDDQACTIAFSRASVGYPSGYPVTASAEWTATWVGVEADGTAVGGDLDPLSRDATVNVPVAEIQTVVTGPR